MMSCTGCGRPLLPAHEDFGVCGWCVMESNEKSRDRMKVPSYRFGKKKNGEKRPPGQLPER